jgi:hypothetical protein
MGSEWDKKGKRERTCLKGRHGIDQIDAGFTHGCQLGCVSGGVIAERGAERGTERGTERGAVGF